jgi:hypothetical protein
MTPELIAWGAGQRYNVVDREGRAIHPNPAVQLHDTAVGPMRDIYVVVTDVSERPIS